MAAGRASSSVESAGVVKSRPAPRWCRPLGATLRSFGRQAPPLVWAGSWGVLAACPPGVGLCSFRGRGFCLPRTTAALAGPWALPIPPGAVLRGPGLGDGSVPVTIAGRIPPPCTGELDIDGRSARPWCVTPSPARLRLALSTSGACDHMTVSLTSPWPALWPAQFLPDLGDACQRDSCLHRRLVALGEMGRSSGSGPIGDQRGIDRFAGRSETADGRSDLREAVIRWLLAIWRFGGKAGNRRFSRFGEKAGIRWLHPVWQIRR